jgi:hypothetical protein
MDGEYRHHATGIKPASMQKPDPQAPGHTSPIPQLGLRSANRNQFR